jgi:hypothetical protein
MQRLSGTGYLAPSQAGTRHMAHQRSVYSAERNGFMGRFENRSGAIDGVYRHLARSVLRVSPSGSDASFLVGWAALPAPRRGIRTISRAWSVPFGTPFGSKSSLRVHSKSIISSAQTERRGDAGPARDLLGRKASPANSNYGGYEPRHLPKLGCLDDLAPCSGTQRLKHRQGRAFIQKTH